MMAVMKTSSLFAININVLFLLLRSGLCYTTMNKILLPANVTNPESLSFDRGGGGPYVTVADGRILKWLGPTLGFTDFAYTSPNRTKVLCDGTNNLDLGPTCGRPLALDFNYRTGDLYITDAFYGLLVVGSNGGLATQLSSGYKYLSGLDVESYTGYVYMTDASLTYDIRNMSQPNFTPDSTGRLLKYDPYSLRVTVLLSGLAGVGGPSVGVDRNFILVPESVTKVIRRYWLEGIKIGTNEVFMTNIGIPKYVKRATNAGEYWVAVEKPIEPSSVITEPQGLRVNASALVLETVSLSQFVNMTITSVLENNNGLYVGSRSAVFVGNYTN